MASRAAKLARIEALAAWTPPPKPPDERLLRARVAARQRPEVAHRAEAARIFYGLAVADLYSPARLPTPRGAFIRSVRPGVPFEDAAAAIGLTSHSAAIRLAYLPITPLVAAGVWFIRSWPVDGDLPRHLRRP